MLAVEAVAPAAAGDGNKNTADNDASEKKDRQSLPCGQQQEGHEDRIPHIRIDIALDDGLQEVEAGSVDGEPDPPQRLGEVLTGKPDPRANAQHRRTQNEEYLPYYLQHTLAPALQQPVRPQPAYLVVPRLNAITGPKGLPPTTPFTF